MNKPLESMPCPLCEGTMRLAGTTKVIHGGDEEHAVIRYVCSGPESHTAWITSGPAKLLSVITVPPHTSGDVGRTTSGAGMIGTEESA